MSSITVISVILTLLFMLNFKAHAGDHGITVEMTDPDTGEVVEAGTRKSFYNPAIGLKSDDKGEVDPGVIDGLKKKVSDFGDKLVCNEEKEQASGLTPNPQEMKSNFQSLKSQLAAIPCQPTALPQFEKELNTFVENYKKCVDRHHQAKLMCLEKCSPEIKKMMAGANAVLAGMTGVGMVDACSGMGNLMQVAQMGLTGFTGNCGAQKLLCDNSCGPALSSLKKMKEILPKINASTCASENPASAQGIIEIMKSYYQGKIEPEIEEATEKSVAKNKTECASYATNLASAGSGLLSAVKSMKDAAKCKKDTIGNVGALDTRAKCDKPENKEDPDCKCIANPRLAGCPGATGVGGVAAETGGFAATTAATTPAKGASNLSLGGGNGSNPVANGDSSSGAGLPGSPSGGGTNLGGGGLSNSADAKGDPTTVRKINPSIYGGDGGGGGGWGSSGGGGGGGDAGSAALQEKIHQEREIASLRQQLSSGGGKTNWEKIQDRYYENKPTFLFGR